MAPTPAAHDTIEIEDENSVLNRHTTDHSRREEFCPMGRRPRGAHPAYVSTRDELRTQKASAYSAAS